QSNELGQSPWPRLGAKPEAAADAASPGFHVPKPLPRRDGVVVEAGAVVDHRDDALVAAKGDLDVGVTRARVLARVSKPFLNDAEDLDLLVRSELDVRVDVKVDPELSVRSQEVDVAAQSGVEGGGPA